MSRYTISQLYSEVDHYHLHALYVHGHLGVTEIPLAMLATIVRDGLTKEPEPDRTSPWLLEVPRTGIGILVPNPGGKRRKDGTRGQVRIRSKVDGVTTGGNGSRQRTRHVWRGRKPVSNAPLAERIQSRETRRLHTLSLTPRLQ